jgi:sodium/hydrogen antiporter
VRHPIATRSATRATRSLPEERRQIDRDRRNQRPDRATVTRCRLTARHGIFPMVSLFVFSLTLLAGVLISELAHRTIVSTAVLFLIVGFVAGSGVLGYITPSAESPVVAQLANLALVAVLFTDALNVGYRDLISAWHLPGRALLLGMPLTVAGTAILAHYVAGTSWTNAVLIGGVLSPTDPVFAAAIVGQERVSRELRHLLNVESGVNDALALPIIFAALALAGGAQHAVFKPYVGLALGGVLGIAVPWVAVKVERSRFFAVSEAYAPFFAFAVGLIVFAAATLTHVNEYLAAFAAGVTMVTLRPEVRAEFHKFGEQLSELLKLAAVLVFGALITPTFLAEIRPSGYLFALLALLLPRAIALWLALLGCGLGWRDKLAAMWFGPRGFAAVVYGFMVLRSGVPGSDECFHLIGLVVVASIIAHSSTDVVIARWLERSMAATAAGAAHRRQSHLAQG